MGNISVKQLDEFRKSGKEHTLLDIREHEELAIASLDGVLHIPMNSLPENLDQLSKEHPLIVMCHTGGRSAQVEDWLLSQGYSNALNLEGGIAAWSAEIDPNVPSY